MAGPGHAAMETRKSSRGTAWSRGWRSRMRRACVLRGTVLGPVLLSANTRMSSWTADQRRRTISPLRHPVRSRRRMMSACCRLLFRVCLSSTRCRRPISSRDRNRVSAGRRFLLTPRAGPGWCRYQAAGNCDVHDLPEKVESTVGPARGSPAVCVEPAPDLCRGYAVQRFRSEGGQQLPGEDGSHAPLG